MAEGGGVEPLPGIARHHGFRNRLPAQRSGTLQNAKKPPRLITGGGFFACRSSTSSYTSVPLAIASESKLEDRSE
jgi:hypothetical protein